MVINRNGVEYNVEKAIKNWTVYNIWWISREEYQRVLDLLWVTEQELADALDDLDDANAEILRLQWLLAQKTEDYDAISNLFSPVRPTGANLSYSCSWYWGDVRDRVNLMLWNTWVYFFTQRTSWDTAPVDYAYDYADGCIYFVNTANNYALTASRLWQRSIPMWKRSNYATVDWWWGTRYLWRKWNQLKYHAYKYSVTNSEHTTTYYTYWLYTLDIDWDNRTFSTNAYYQTVTTPYEYDWDIYHPIYRDHPELWYENLSYYPDSAWTLVGNPNGNNFNPLFHWYRVLPVFEQTSNEQNCKNWNIYLEFTKVNS